MAGAGAFLGASGAACGGAGPRTRPIKVIVEVVALAVRTGMLGATRQRPGGGGALDLKGAVSSDRGRVR